MILDNDDVIILHHQQHNYYHIVITLIWFHELMMMKGLLRTVATMSTVPIGSQHKEYGRVNTPGICLIYLIRVSNANQYKSVSCSMERALSSYYSSLCSGARNVMSGVSRVSE